MEQECCSVWRNHIHIRHTFEAHSSVLVSPLDVTWMDATSSYKQLFHFSVPSFTTMEGLLRLRLKLKMQRVTKIGLQSLERSHFKREVSTNTVCIRFCVVSSALSQVMFYDHQDKPYNRYLTTKLQAQALNLTWVKVCSTRILLLT